MAQSPGRRRQALTKFEHTVDARLSPELLWSLLGEAFTDSERGAIWPNERSFEALDRNLQQQEDGERVASCRRALRLPAPYDSVRHSFSMAPFTIQVWMSPSSASVSEPSPVSGL